MKNKCPKCGTKRSHGYDLCFTCGYKFFSESRQIPTISDKKVEKSFTTCPHCRQKLPLGAKFCVTCGQKIEVLKPIPSISEKKVKKSFTTCPHCRQKLHLRAKFCFNCGQKVEVLKPIPPISDIEEETPKITLAEEIQPIPPVYVKKEEKRKKEPRVCKFCGMRLPKNKAFCLQCGMIIKIK